MECHGFEPFIHQFFSECCIPERTNREGTHLKFNTGPEKLPGPKRKGSSSNHHFSGAMLNFGGVSVTNEGLGWDSLKKMVHNPGVDWHPGRGPHPIYIPDTTNMDVSKNRGIYPQIIPFV